jgi:hypothetical protein
LDHHRTGDHERHEVVEEWAGTVHGIEALGLRAGQLGHARGDHLETSVLEAAVDLADHILRDGVGLDDGKCTFQGH